MRLRCLTIVGCHGLRRIEDGVLLALLGFTGGIAFACLSGMVWYTFRITCGA